MLVIKNMEQKDKIYYKYRSLDRDNLSYILDIILKTRLYCAKYHELNDPMEGYYASRENLSKDFKEYIRNRKGNYRICSLAQDDINKLLWAHYADGFKGIAIGVKTKELVHPVNYNGIQKLNELLIHPNQDITSIFSNKLEEWKGENESRLIINKPGNFINVEVVEIIFGLRMVENLKELLTSLVQGLNRNIVLKQQNRNFENIIITNKTYKP
jgi:hypothetical protein